MGVPTVISSTAAVTSFAGYTFPALVRVPLRLLRLLYKRTRFLLEANTLRFGFCSCCVSSPHQATLALP